MLMSGSEKVPDLTSPSLPHPEATPATTLAGCRHHTCCPLWGHSPQARGGERRGGEERGGEELLRGDAAVCCNGLLDTGRHSALGCFWRGVQQEFCGPLQVTSALLTVPSQPSTLQAVEGCSQN
jgi:hypothetical protein